MGPAAPARWRAWARWGAWLALLLAGTAAQAASYTFPGSLPPGCSGSGGNYTCSAGSLNYGDTVTIASPKPATITVTGNLGLNGASVNASGSASDLNLIVNGTLTPGYRAVIKANVVAYAFNDVNGEVSLTGSLRTTSGNVALAYRSTVTGSIAVDAGNATLADEVSVGGGITASGSVTLGYRNVLGGSISAGAAATVGQEATVGGAVAATGSGNVSIGYKAEVTGNISSASGSLTLLQESVARACVQAGSGASISLGWRTSASRVCCGALGSCSNTCVSNSSSYAMPSLCATPSAATLLGKYEFQEASWNGTSSELKDTAGHASGPFHGKAKGSPMPTPATSSPARSGSPGTCGYASLPGPAAGGGGFTITSLPVSTSGGQQTTVAFWMYWDGTDWTMPVGFNTYDLIFGSGSFGFNTSNGDIYGVSSSSLASGWHHVVAVFTNGGVGGNQLWLDGVQQALSQRMGTPLNSGAVVASTLQVGGWTRDSGYRFSGRIDQLRVYQGAATASQVATLYAETATCPSSTTELARYDFKEGFYAGTAGELKDTAGHASGPYNGRAQGTPKPSNTSASPARSGSPGTCSYASLPGPEAGGGAFVVSDLPVSTSAGAKTSVSFWMYWDGVSEGTPIGWDVFNLWFTGSSFGFNTGGNDIYGISNSGLGAGWHHVVAVFSNGGVTGGKLYIDGVLKTLTQRVDSPNNSSAVVSSTLTIGGWGYDTDFRFVGRLDQVRVYNGELDSTQVSTLYNETASCDATEIARYDFDETSYAGTAGELKDSTGYTGGPFNGTAQGSPLPTPLSSSPARSGSPGSCGYASLPGTASNGGAFRITGLPVSTTTGVRTTVSFWMYWDGTDSVMPIGWDQHDLWLKSGHFGFNTNASDVYGISNTGLANGWHHVVAVFTNGSVTSNKLWIDGVAQTLSQRTGTPNNARAVVNGSLTLGGWNTSTAYRLTGRIDQVRVLNGEPTSAQVATLYAETPSTCVSGPHHLEIRHGSGTGLTCTPSTVTVRACQDAACTSLYTGGVSGTLGATGGSVLWPSTAAFSIAAGSSSTTVDLQATTTTPTLLGVASSTPSASSAATCNFGSPSCTFTAADAGFIFDVAHHVSETSQTVTVSAVRKSDNGTVCTPAFGSTKTVNFSCGYTNPGTGTLAVRVGGVALNAANNAAAACDGSLRPVSLAFNASGVASTTVQYADVGQVLLSARYDGSGSDAGLVMTGSDSFIAAPDSLAVTGVSSGPIQAGSSFSATVSARNSANAITPNYGRESSAEGALLAWVRIQPTGSGAVNGSFSGSLGSFSGGSASTGNLAWTEVGRGDLLARSSNTSGYLGTGLRAFGASPATGARFCALENASCVLPGGTTATLYYGENGSYAARTGQTGTVSCSNGVFGDPLVGTPKKCYYVATSATTGSVGDFIPHHFSVAATAACGAFSYAGQPFATTVTAHNATGGTTLNFNGSTATTTPSFAQAVTLSDANALGVGSLSGHTIAASAFASGVASGTPSYAFTSKTTAPQSLVLRAGNGALGSAAISSLGYAEPTMALRSGRLRLANAFGQATASLQLSAAVDYWAGTGWLLNSADSCTTVAGASVALSNPRDATGAASATTTSAGALAIGSGSGSITLAAPTPAGRSLTLDVAVNLGSGAADQSCHASHPATTGAGKPWLRAQNGSCSAASDRDPAARASFGIFSPESRKTVHVRDLF